MRMQGWTAMLVIAVCGPWAGRGRAQDVTFEELWSRAQTSSAELAALRTERARAEAARAGVRGVLAENPSLRLEGGPRFQGSGRSYDLAAGLSQPLRVSGQGRREREWAGARGQRVEAEVAEAEWSFRQHLRSSYRAAALARARAELLAAALAFEERVHTLVERRVKAGEASPLDAPLAEVEVVQARQALIEANQELLEHRLELARHAGGQATDLPLPVASLEEVELPALELLVGAARERGPHLAALKARVREASAATRLADRQRTPQPELGAAYVREGSTPAAGPVSHSVLATLSVPLALWDRNQGERALARAETRIASAGLAAEEGALSFEVARLRSRVEAAQQRLALYRGSLLPRLNEHLERLEKALALGELSVFDVLGARQRLVHAHLDALAAREAHSAALGELEALIGHELAPAAERGAP
jgi:cobalt-zinc-cadmium efflux system outer membrane protein